MAPASNKEEDISLDEYSAFQYMLSRPAVAKAVVNQITFFVFYNEPHDERKTESEHKVLVQGHISFINYYCCCVALLPSHVLGMSEWMSAEDYASKKVSPKAKAKLQPGDTLRRFRYSYYRGLLQVDTRHVFVGYANNGKDQRFRLYEYIDCPISPWIIVHGVFALLASFVVYFLQAYGVCSQISFPLPVALVLVLLHSTLLLTGVQMW
mmetsp:Transcript_25057/g.45130  ORF Transcript_25057/g.45130 Transcript_25057/m.45130 type:complete len:209 (+) Transcript_25057:63-689(+)